jgi:hypothetical protein
LEADVAFDFPANPNVNDKYEQAGTTWIWNGGAWDLQDQTEFLLDGKINRSGDTMSAPLRLPPANPVHGYEATHKNYVDQVSGGVIVADEPPADAFPNALFWDSDGGGLYINFVDADSKQWVQINGVGGAGGAVMEDAPADSLRYARRQVNWVPSAEYGDVKSGFQGGDHNGWIKLDGRATSLLSTGQQQQATILGFTTNLPNATDCVERQITGAPGSVTGEWTISQAMLPNVSLTADDAGDHKHTFRGAGGYPTQTGTTFADFHMHWNKSSPIQSGDYWTYTVWPTLGMQDAGAHSHTVPLGGSGAALTPKTLVVNKFIFLGS